MVPFRSENSTNITPFVVYSLITVNLILFFYELFLGERSNYLFELYALIPQELTASLGENPPSQSVPEIYTLITSQFLHSGLSTYWL